jgi:hypothetical protein
MISAIMYGRNDSYGYNLHKRAAISLNTLAETLTDPQDEIVFVDYTTVDDLPTFPEAIGDTLTARARAMLRIIRVRGSVHREGKAGPRPHPNEPLARNIGIRHARPDNPWVLSTNTDMVFIPRQDRSLSEAVSSLEEGYYALPRFEVPETLWETVNRLDPLGIVESFARWGARYCLRETVLCRPYVVFDGPGDFQLFPRKTIEAIHGFDERMVYGWHVDSNLCKRMHLYFGRMGSLAEEFQGYHCDHTRVTTPAHASNRTENNWSIFCETLDTPYIPEQADTWGCAGRVFEEIRIGDRPKQYLQTLDALYSNPDSPVTNVVYNDESFNNNLFYNTGHAFPYISDSLVSYPTTLQLAYIGRNEALLTLLGDFWIRMGFENPILVHNPISFQAPALSLLSSDRQVFRFCEDYTKLTSAELLLVDTHCSEKFAALNAYGHPALSLTPESLRFCINLSHTLLQLATEEQLFLQLGKPPRKFIVIGLQSSVFEALFSQIIGFIAVPYSCHIRHGFVRSEADIVGPHQAFTRLAALDQATLDRVCTEAARTAGLEPEGLEIMRAYHILLKLARAGVFAGPGGVPVPHGIEQLRTGLLLATMLGQFQDAALFFWSLFGIDPELADSLTR